MITEIMMIVACTCLYRAVFENLPACSIKESAVEQMSLCSDQTSNSCSLKISYVCKCQNT